MEEIRHQNSKNVGRVNCSTGIPLRIIWTHCRTSLEYDRNRCGMKIREILEEGKPPKPRHPITPVVGVYGGRNGCRKFEPSLGKLCGQPEYH